MTIQRVLAACLILQLVAAPLATPRAHAEPIRSQDATMGLSVTEELGSTPRGNEYVSGNTPGAVLMQVNLWGAVHKPGIHHVPTQTDLLTLLSYAGGPQKDAQLDEVVLRRGPQQNRPDQVNEIDLKKIITKPGQTSIVLEPNDTVYIPQKDEGVSNTAMRNLTFISIIFGVAVSALLISDHFKSTPTR